MKLSELIQLKKDLETLDFSTCSKDLDVSHNSIKEIFGARNIDTNDLVTSVSSMCSSVTDKLLQINETINNYKNYLQKEIESRYVQYYQASEYLYETSVLDDAPEYILERCKHDSVLRQSSLRDLFFGRLGMYNSWKYPAVEIRPAHGLITDQIKGCDPLYLVDTDESLFEQVKTKWHSAYQARLRYHTINEQHQKPLHGIPNNQIGLIVSVDYFNYKTMNIVENFLEDFYLKLRPGGIAMFTYNNCDLPYGVRNLENRFCCFTPEHAVIDVAKRIGFEIVRSFNELENVSWLEIKKPGKISTLRGGQTLGEIRSFN